MSITNQRPTCVRRLWTIALGCALLVFWAPAGAIKGDRLYARSVDTVIRTTPKDSGARLLVVRRGHLLVGVTASGRWIKVGVARSGGKIGWVRRRDLTTVAPAQVDVPSTAAYETLSAEVEAFNRGVLSNSGVRLFSHIEAPMRDVVRLTVTDAWRALAKKAKRRSLAPIANRWAQLNGNQRPTWIDAVDASGTVLMSAARNR